jgi:hypothetical protein
LDAFGSNAVATYPSPKAGFEDGGLENAALAMDGRGAAADIPVGQKLGYFVKIVS